MQPLLLNEAYYGKNKELLLVEKHLIEMKRELNEGKNINKSNHLKQICNILTNLFNVNIEIIIETNRIYSERSFITSVSKGAIKDIVPIKDMFDGKIMYEVEETKKGVRFKKRSARFPVMYLGYADIKHKSVSDIMSTILHEIGHLFFYFEKMTGIQRQASVIAGMYENIMTVIKGYNKIKKLYDSLKDKMSAKVLNSLIRLSKYYLSLIQSATITFIGIFSPKGSAKLEKALHGSEASYAHKSIDDLKVMIANKFPKSVMSARLFYLINDAIKNPLQVLADNFFGTHTTIVNRGYDAEKYADNFAVMYGYGTALAEGFATSTIKALDNDATITAMLLTRSFYQIQWMLYFFDPHPDAYQRILLVKKKLILEVTTNKNLTAPQKKEIREQIEKVDKIINSNDNSIKAIRDVHEFLNFGKFRDKVLSQTSDEDLYR